MNPTFLLALQSVAIFGQLFNAGLATTPHHFSPFVTISVAAGVGAIQYFVQHVGNQTLPPGAVR